MPSWQAQGSEFDSSYQKDKEKGRKERSKQTKIIKTITFIIILKRIECASVCLIKICRKYIYMTVIKC